MEAFECPRARPRCPELAGVQGSVMRFASTCLQFEDFVLEARASHDDDLRWHSLQYRIGKDAGFADAAKRCDAVAYRHALVSDRGEVIRRLRVSRSVSRGPAEEMRTAEDAEVRRERNKNTRQDERDYQKIVLLRRHSIAAYRLRSFSDREW